jgi:hypothetical protein
MRMDLMGWLNGVTSVEEPWSFRSEVSEGGAMKEGVLREQYLCTW